MSLKYHECDNPDVEWEDFELGDLGETVERRGFCKNCKKNVREVWIFSCELVDE